jgi:aminoglycoside phosphotransferase (APT) family kinase protein
MNRPWDPDVAIDPDFAGATIAAQFPEFEGATVEPIGEGFDNAAFLVGGATVFRLPRRAFAAPFLTNEARILPLLAPHLPVPIPVPSHLGRPSDGYPYPFAGYPFLPGRTACRFPWTDAKRAELAPTLGRFLGRLHSVPVDEATRAWAPVDEIRRADLPYRLEMLRERARAVDGTAKIVALAETLAEAPAATRTTWVHGDLHPRHLLVDDSGGLSAVIDWGDVHLGDPALDLSVAFTFLPPFARPAFRAAYGEIDDATWDRARFRALFYALILTEYGEAVGDDAMRTVGRTAMRLGPS